jgi:hypothetical protein
MTYQQYAICAGGCGEEYEKAVMARAIDGFYCDSCWEQYRVKHPDPREFGQLKIQWQASRGTRLILEHEGLIIQSPMIDLTDKNIALWSRTLRDEYRRFRDSTPTHIHHHLIRLSDTLYTCPGGM